jgi:hypothetical protein
MDTVIHNRALVVKVGPFPGILVVSASWPLR